MNRFLPFMTGFYTTAPGMMPTSKGDFTRIFDIDEQYQKYIANKTGARKENIHKYYCEFDFSDSTRSCVVSFIQSQLKQEYPDFTIDLASGFDSICSQLPEDIAVVQLDGDRDYLAAIHLCSPNHWDPRTKIGKPFNEIHAPVPHIERTVKNYSVMMKMIIDKGPFTRFAWGISTDDRLNHHSEPPPGVDADEWHGRRMIDDSTDFFVRVERQNLIGLKDVNAFIFTIRTFFYRVDELTFAEKERLTLAINSMTRESLEYKGMYGFKDLLLQKLK